MIEEWERRTDADNPSPLQGRVQSRERSKGEGENNNPPVLSVAEGRGRPEPVEPEATVRSTVVPSEARPEPVEGSNDLPQPSSRA